MFPNAVGCRPSCAMCCSAWPSARTCPHADRGDDFCGRRLCCAVATHCWGSACICESVAAACGQSGRVLDCHVEGGRLMGRLEVAAGLTRRPRAAEQDRAVVRPPRLQQSLSHRRIGRIEASPHIHGVAGRVWRAAVHLEQVDAPGSELVDVALDDGTGREVEDAGQVVALAVADGGICHEVPRVWAVKDCRVGGSSRWGGGSHTSRI